MSCERRLTLSMLRSALEMKGCREYCFWHGLSKCACLARVEVGTVKAWNEERGFGFVQVDGVEGDVYVHRSGANTMNLETLLELVLKRIRNPKDPSYGHNL
eukprot:4939475-Amphidinium_carterae.1